MPGGIPDLGVAQPLFEVPETMGLEGLYGLGKEVDGSALAGLGSFLDEPGSTLERETLLLSTYAGLLAWHLEQHRTSERPASGEPHAVSQAREYL